MKRSEQEMKLLQNVVNQAAPERYMDRKGEIIDYYKDTYGQKNWTRALAERIRELGLAKNKKGEDISVKNIQRRFQGERAIKGEGRSSHMYKEIGKTLPSVGRQIPNEIKIKVEGTQENGTRDRTIVATLTGSTLINFVTDPQYTDIWEAYGINPEVFEGEADYDTGGLGVTSVTLL